MYSDLLYHVASFCDVFTRSMMKFVNREMYDRITVNLTVEDIKPHITSLDRSSTDILFRYYNKCIYSYCKLNRTNVYCIFYTNFAAFRHVNDTYFHMKGLFNKNIDEIEKMRLTLFARCSCKTIRSYIDSNISEKYFSSSITLKAKRGHS